jgi:hypothetical protein
VGRTTPRGSQPDRRRISRAREKTTEDLIDRIDLIDAAVNPVDEVSEIP